MKGKRPIRLRSEAGFTIIELTIVIAIMGILSAVLIPSFTTMSRKAKIKADITTVKNLQAQIELYDIENEDSNSIIGQDNKLVTGYVAKLVTGKYIKKSDTTGTDPKEIRLQCKDAGVVYCSDKEHLELTLSAIKDKEYAKTMGELDQAWIKDVDTIAQQ